MSFHFAYCFLISYDPNHAKHIFPTYIENSFPVKIFIFTNFSRHRFDFCTTQHNRHFIYVHQISRINVISLDQTHQVFRKMHSENKEKQIFKRDKMLKWSDWIIYLSDQGCNNSSPTKEIKFNQSLSYLHNPKWPASQGLPHASSTRPCGPSFCSNTLHRATAPPTAPATSPFSSSPFENKS